MWRRSTGPCVQRGDNSPEWIRIKRRYAVLKGRRERDVVRPPTAVQITPELPTATAFNSRIESGVTRNLVRCRPLLQSISWCHVNSSNQTCWWILVTTTATGYYVFYWRRRYCGYTTLARSLGLKLKTQDLFLTNMQPFTSQDINWCTGLVWITCGLLWCFYQLFGCSFWRHPFTAEDSFVSKWCNAELLQICSDE